MTCRTQEEQARFNTALIRMIIAILSGGAFLLWPELMVKIAVWGNLAVLVPLNLIIMALLAFR